MRFDWATLALQSVNLLVLIWILRRFLFRPVADIVAKRRAEAIRLLDDAKARQVEAEAARKAAETEADRLADGRAEALRAAAAEAEAQRQSLLAAARDEAAGIVAQAHEDARRRDEQDAAAISERAGELALDIAEKLMQRLPDAARVAGFVAGLADALAALPEASRAEIGADGAPLRLRAARPLEPEEVEACQKALARALGRPVELAVEVDPKADSGAGNRDAARAGAQQLARGPRSPGTGVRRS